MKRSYCHICCTWMLSLPCESSHETSSVGGFLVFLQVTWLWEALLSHFLHCFSPVWSLMFHQFSWSREAHIRLCAPLVSPLQEYFNNSFSHLMKRSCGHIWCTWMPSLLCESSHESCGFSHVSPSHMTLRTSWHTLSNEQKNVSLVWFSHVSSIHLIRRSSCKTLCTHSFSILAVLLLLFMSFYEENLLSR